MAQSKQDEFTSKIENAIDDLFTPKRKIEIDPATNEVKQNQDEIFLEMEAQAETQATPTDGDEMPALSLEDREDESSTVEEFNQGDAKVCADEMDRCYLAIDWEVTQENISAYQAALEKLDKTLKLDKRTRIGKVALLMGQVLEAMSDSPKDVPATAAKALQKGNDILRIYIDLEGQLDDESSEVAQATIQVLEKSLSTPAKSTPTEAKPKPQSQPEKPAEPVATEDDLLGDDIGGEEETLDDDLIPDIPEEIIPQELLNRLNLHLSILSQCINRILPLEEIFAANERYNKLLLTHRELRELLEEEKELLSTAIRADYSFAKMYPGTRIPEGLGNAMKTHLVALRQTIKKLKSFEEAFSAKKGYKKLFRVEKENREQLETQRDALTKALVGDFKEATGKEGARGGIPEELYETVKNHVNILERCVKQIIPMENLFGKTRGYEKLYKRQKSVRKDLESQQSRLVSALAGNYEIIPAAQGRNLVTGSTESQELPWKDLFVARWNDELVGFIPEQILYEGEAPASVKKINQGGASHLALKRLKCWPWSSYDKLMVERVGGGNAAALDDMQFPLLNHPSPFKSVPGSDSKPALLLLKYNNRSAAAILDNHLERLDLSEECEYAPAYSPGNPLVVGYITTMLDRIPVISLENWAMESSHNEA